MTSFHGKIKLCIIAAVFVTVLYLAHTVPLSEESRLLAPRPVKPASDVELQSNFVTQHLLHSNTSTDQGLNFSEAFATAGVSAHHGSDQPHSSVLPPQFDTNGNFSDSRHLAYTEPSVNDGEGAANLANCYDMGKDGKNVSVHRYRNCMKVITHEPPLEGKLVEIDETLMRMARRRRVYEAECRLPAVEVTGAPNFQDVVYEPEHELSYCKTAKAGSSTILSFIFNISGVDFDAKNKVGLHEAARMEFPALPGHSGAQKMTKNAFSFTSVRHPFRRLVSAYCNKVVEGKEEILKQHNNEMLSYRLADTLDIVRKKLPNYHFETSSPSRKKSSMLKSTRKYMLNTPGKEEFMKIHGEPENLVPGVPSFREFMLFVALSILQCGGDHICLSELDTHFRPQVVRCNPCAWHFDFILKTETLREDLVWLGRVVGATSVSYQKRTVGTRLSGNIPRLNSSGGRCASYDQYMHALTSEEIDSFYSAYYNDFRYFGYEPFD